MEFLELRPNIFHEDDLPELVVNILEKLNLPIEPLLSLLGGMDPSREWSFGENESPDNFFFEQTPKGKIFFFFFYLFIFFFLQITKKNLQKLQNKFVFQRICC